MRVTSPVSTLITYISDYGGIVHRVVVIPSIPAPGGLIESVLPDGTDVPFHRDKHLTPAEGPVLLAGQSQVQLLICGQVGVRLKDPVCVTVSLWVRLDKKETCKNKRLN